MKTIILFFTCFLAAIFGFAQNPISAADKENFKTVALSKDQTGMPIIKKWVVPIRYKIYGAAEDYMVKEVDTVFSQLKLLTGLDIAKSKDDDEVNFEILIGKAADFEELLPTNARQYFNQYGGYNYRVNNKGEIFKAVNLMTPESYAYHQDVRHALRKGIARQLGFFTPLENKPNSLFYSQNNNRLKFDSYDTFLIRLLYNPEMKPGLNLPQVEEVLNKM